MIARDQVGWSEAGGEEIEFNGDMDAGGSRDQELFGM